MTIINNNLQSRKTYLDSLRGVAASIVVIVHYFCAFYPYTVFGSQNNEIMHSSIETLMFYPPFGILAAGHFAVCLFFILSGYVLSYNSLGDTIKLSNILIAIIKRPIRLGGIVWFSMLSAALLWHFELFYNNPVSLISSSEWLANNWVGQFELGQFSTDIITASFSKGANYNNPLWTIKIELYGSLMVYVFLLLLGNFKYRLLILIGLIALSIDNLYQGFWLGILFADLQKNHTFRNYLQFNSIQFYVLLLIFVFISSYPHVVNQEFLKNTIYAFLPDDENYGGGYPMLSAAIIFILVISNTRLQIFLNHAKIKYLGNISYSLYAIHVLVIGSFSSWLFLNTNNYLGYHLSFFLVLILGVVATIVISSILTKYIDTPFIKLSRYLSSSIIKVFPSRVFGIAVK